MAINPAYIPNVVAAAGAVGAQYQAVKYSAANTVTVVDNATDDAVGILQNAPAAAGDECVVVFFGTCQWKAGATVNLPDQVHTDANGDCIAATTAQITQGMAMHGAALADGEYATVTVNFLNVLA